MLLLLMPAAAASHVGPSHVPSRRIGWRNVTAATSHVGVACSSEHFPVGTAGDMQIAKERAQNAAHKVISSHLTFLGKDVLQIGTSGMRAILKGEVSRRAASMSTSTSVTMRSIKSAIQ